MQMTNVADAGERPYGQPEAQLLQAYSHAEMEERRCWDKVKGRHPGAPGHEPVAWSEWVSAARVLVDLARQVHGAPTRR